MKFRSAVFLIVSFVAISCNGQESKIIKTIVPKDFAEAINTTQNPQILDVRTPPEFSEGHITNAANVNWLGDHFIIEVEKFDKTKPVFIYCRSGARSKKASEKLQELGFKNINEMQGGIISWNNTGLSIIID